MPCRSSCQCLTEGTDRRKRGEKGVEEKIAQERIGENVSCSSSSLPLSSPLLSSFEFCLSPHIFLFSLTISLLLFSSLLSTLAHLSTYPRLTSQTLLLSSHLHRLFSENSVQKGLEKRVDIRNDCLTCRPRVAVRW